MKKLEDFKNEEIKKTNLFVGGKRTPTSYTQWKDDCQYNITDSFNDRDGDGVWDSNEWGEYETKRTLVCCD
jgi:hypothetical protein